MLLDGNVKLKVARPLLNRWQQALNEVQASLTTWLRPSCAVIQDFLWLKRDEELKGLRKRRPLLIPPPHEQALTFAM